MHRVRVAHIRQYAKWLISTICHTNRFHFLLRICFTRLTVFPFILLVPRCTPIATKIERRRKRNGKQIVNWGKKAKETKWSNNIALSFWWFRSCDSSVAKSLSFSAQVKTKVDKQSLLPDWYLLTHDNKLRQKTKKKIATNCLIHK